MTSDSSNLFPARWPVKRPELIQLYSLATPNGQKAGIVLEETGLDYEAHKVDIMDDQQFDEDYKLINPNSKIPTLVDPDGPDGKPIAIMESAAILLYLADKTASIDGYSGTTLISANPRGRLETMQWLFFQIASIGPMFGQFGHFFKIARDKTSDDYARERYRAETERLLGVLDKRLQSREYLIDDGYSIADIATVTWINALDFYEGKDAVNYGSFGAVQNWVERCMARPAVQRGVKVCPMH